MNTPTTPVIVLLSKDLFFISKVKEVAASLNRAVAVAKSPDRLREVVGAGETPGLLLIDLEKSGCDVAWLAEFYAPLASRGWRCLSFFSHVHDELQSRATELGLGDVMPRSRFVKVLPEVLASL